MDEIEEVQKLCEKNMNRFGYNLIKNQNELEDADFKIINEKFDHMDVGK